MPLRAPPSTPIRRLIVAFLALDTALILLVIGLLHSALARLDEQRALRQRMVAERVFDEVEREIGSVLQHEAERPSAAYDAVDTDPTRWSGFVLGYYRREPGLVLLAAARLDHERIQRLTQTLEQSELSLKTAQQRLASSDLEQPPRASLDETHEARPPTSSPDVVRQLNRSVKVRERRMHDFLTRFALARAGTLIVAERADVAAKRSEGLVIDVPALIQTIQGWVLGSQGLGEVAELTLRVGDTTASAGDRFVHRLAAPFDAYAISLRLARLDDEDASSTLYGFAASFVLAAGLGMFAIYRMVAVQLQFAERRNNFVAAVTHELRTPLTSIRMYGEMLRDGIVEDDATRREYYAIITAEGERLTRLINNVMEHARLRRGQRRAHLERSDAGEIVREVVELMRPHIEREGFGVRLGVAVGLPRVRLDCDALKQMLFNVLDNALKYGRAAALAQIDVACAASERGGVVISVRDYGPGVLESQLSHLFEPFYRGENELTRRHKGAGLGLALVRDLADSMKVGVQCQNCGPGFEIRISLDAA